LMLTEDVSFLDPETAVFEAMLAGWERQQRVRFLKPATIQARLHLVRRLAAMSNQYPWQWTAGEAEAFFSRLRSGNRPVQMSTLRGHEGVLRLFLQYITDARYQWPEVCMRRFGMAPTMVLHEFNSIRHVTDVESRPGRRALSYDEVQRLFDAADGLADQSRARGRKGGVPALRDSIVLKTVYAFGLRRREAWGLDLADLRQNPQVRRFKRCGALFVRWGKGSRGSPPQRRTVLLVPEMDWLVEPFDDWLEKIRPMLDSTSVPALFLTERGSRLALRGVNDAFHRARDAAGLDPDLDLHCLRHSYVTHLVEFGYPPRFIQAQVGHAYPSTTSIYTDVSDEYRNRLMQKALGSFAPFMWEAP
ncbi:tyrosine-type recombinase/integrase, partial [Amycolatopsis lurida]|uniref:tyrosine-type recombinase/integrase n=1 Tax=Amycolatopsis lurida TaxID=31959 RepID=UPI0036676FE9